MDGSNSEDVMLTPAPQPRVVSKVILRMRLVLSTWYQLATGGKRVGMQLAAQPGFCDSYLVRYERQALDRYLDTT